MGFNLDNYEQVKDRITRFYKDKPDGRITTELVNDPATLISFAAFKASIYIGETLKATGYAMEQQGQGVNKDAWVENAETSAIGRALANMDYCGTLRPSREEMSKVKQDAKNNTNITPTDVVDSNFVQIKSALIDYIAAGLFEHPENVNKVISDGNVEQMKHALEAAKKKEASTKQV